MKKLFLIFLFLFIQPACFASGCEVTCPSGSLNIIEKESLLNKITGVSFASKKIAEIAIQKELKDELKSPFKANLEIYNVKRLKNGEFKALTLQSEQINYRAASISDFYAQTVCPYNKIIYQDGRVYYPHDLPFKFNAAITNQDINNILNSYEFQRELEKVSLKINGFKGFSVKTPKVNINNGKLNFSIPVETFLSSNPFYINLNADIEVKNNKIVLKNIIFSSNNNIINVDIFGVLVNKINPVAFQMESINSKYCRLYITNSQISGNIINTKGIFIINKNYGR